MVTASFPRLDAHALLLHGEQSTLRCAVDLSDIVLVAAGGVCLQQKRVMAARDWPELPRPALIRACVGFLLRLRGCFTLCTYNCSSLCAMGINCPLFRLLYIYLYFIPTSETDTNLAQCMESPYTPESSIWLHKAGLPLPRSALHAPYWRPPATEIPPAFPPEALAQVITTSGLQYSGCTESYT